MAGWEDAVGFGVAQQHSYYFIWQREQLRSHSSLECHCDSSEEWPHAFHHLFCYSDGPTSHGNGPSSLSVHEIPEPRAGPWALPEETSAPAGNQDELPGDPNLHLIIEEFNKKFMAESEELYDSLMSCHWWPLDIILSNIPDESHPTPQCETVLTMPSN